MAPIATYVFLDLETTGLPSEECNRTKIIELCMVAASREHILGTRPGATPRVLHKLTRCFNPFKPVSQGSTAATGLDNFLLEHEPRFDIDTFQMIENFLKPLTKPICLIAHNGRNFDYPILKRHLERLKVSFSHDMMCADTYHGFYNILETRKTNLADLELSKTVCSVDEADLSADNTLHMQSVNETTPKSMKVTHNRPHSKARRRLPWGEGKKPTDSYRLSRVYERVLNRPAIDAHRAEVDCMLTLEIAVALAKEFVSWVDDNHCPFTEIEAMTIGVRVGLLVLTGLLWGGTNPFIRRGARGLRAVRARSWPAQARAELVFLLGNWRYVAPWLVNQLGSLSYLAAVRRAPLSLAVPAANGLAFAATAAAGAASGLDDPLDKGSILGIALIVVGTALCCWDKAEA